MFYDARMSRFCMVNYLNLGIFTILRIINKIVDRILDSDLFSNKFRWEHKIVQVNKTMLNNKIKSHQVKTD